MIKDHVTTHERLLQKYRPLWGARAGSVVCGGVLATAIFGYPKPEALEVGSMGAVMLLIGYLLGFSTKTLRKEMKDNWRAAFRGTEWRTIGGEAATVLDMDEYGNEVTLSFNRMTSAKAYRLESITPVSATSRELAAAIASANPYDKRFHPTAVIFGVAALMVIGGVLLPQAVAIGYFWLLFSGACYMHCGSIESMRSDDAATVRRLSKTKWRVLDGRVGFIRFAESRGTQDTGYTDYLTIGFDDGSEYFGEKSEMAPVHDKVYASAA
jgi:hypothetical protein